MFSIMLFIFLCFLGMLAVLYYILRMLETWCRLLRDEHAQMRVLLRAMEARLDALGAGAPPTSTSEHAARMAHAAQDAQASAAHDPLLRLSFDQASSSPLGAEGQGTDPALEIHLDPPTAPVR